MIKKTLYHGTKIGGYDSFDPDVGLLSEACTNGIEAGLGVFWAEDKSHALDYTLNRELPSYLYNPYLYEAEIIINNPLHIKSEDVHKLIAEHKNPVLCRENLKYNGYDGVVIDCGGWNEYVIFHNNQADIILEHNLKK